MTCHDGMSNLSTEKLLTSKEVAALLDIPERNLGQWAYRHVGPAYLRIGKHRRYRPEAVEAWLDGQTRGGSPDAPPPAA